MLQLVGREGGIRRAAHLQLAQTRAPGPDVIDELNLYVRGWLNYYKYSSTHKEVLALSVWIRRRVKLYYWKQPRTRRRNLLALGTDPGTVHTRRAAGKGARTRLCDTR